MPYNQNKDVNPLLSTGVAPTKVSKILELASEVFEDRGFAESWLENRIPATGNRAPIELLSEPKGFEIVENILLRIRYGVLA
jgi:putative toxin-antitoxin system antitoxin component (TIGR02293 family)